MTQSNWEISPYFLVRMSGRGQDAMTGLRFGRSLRLVEQLWSLNRWLERERDAVCNGVLFEMIGRSDGAVKSQLVGLKRRLYNGKLPRLQDLGVLSHAGSERGRRQVLRYCARLRRAQSLQDGAIARDVFQAELTLKRMDLAQLMADEEFIKALQVASPSLAVGVLKLVQKHPGEWRKKERQVETKAVRYLSRMVVKTSPFGRFGPVALGRYDAGAGGVIASDLSRSRQRTVSSLNLSFVDRIISQLYRSPEVASKLTLQLNNTCFVDNGDLCFYQPYEKNHVPKYTLLRRGRLIPEIQAVVDVVQQQPSPMTAAGLVAELKQRGFGSHWNDENRVAQFVESLINSGLLVRNFNVPTGQLNRIDSLLDQARTNGVELPEEWRGDLEQLQRYGEGFSDQNLKERHRCIQRSDQLVEKLLNESVDLKDRIARERRLFVEDTYLEGADIVLGEGFWSAIAEDIGAFLDAVFRRDGGGLPYQMLKDIFLQKYGPGGSCDELEKFANELAKTAFRSDLIQSAEFRNSGQINENGLSYLRVLIEESRKNAGQRECLLDADFFRDLAQRFPDGPRGRRSAALHLQFVAASEAELQAGNFQVVLNYTLPGHGRFFTRYCDLFDTGRSEDGLVNHIRGQIASLSESVGGVEVVEMVSVANHNAQVHPELAERVVVMPGEVSAVDSCRQLHIKDVELRHVEDDNSLRFYAGDKEIIPLYMGFFHAMALPYSHRIFVDATPHSYHAERNRLAEVQESLLPFVEADEQRDRVRHYPRLRCGRLVLQRETWGVDRAAIPLEVFDALDDFDLFARVNLWRLDLGLPKSCFVRVKRRRDAAAEQPGVLNANEHKPMYLDFENFFTLRSFIAMLANQPVESLQFEEALPDLGDTPLNVNGQPVTMELQVEFNRS